MNRIQLDQREWDFSAVSKQDAADAWRWEIFRELEITQSGFGLERIDPKLARLITKKSLLKKAFLSLNAEVKSKIFEKVTESWAFREVPFDRAPQTSEEIAGEEMILRLTSCGTHVVQIAWDQPKTRIVQQFHRWLKAHRDRTTHYASLTKPSRVFGAPSKVDPRTWLKDLACYRFSRAGFTSTEAAKILLWISEKRTTGFSRSHFSGACSATKRRLQSLADLLRLSGKHPGRRDSFNPFNVPIDQFR